MEKVVVMFKRFEIRWEKSNIAKDIAKGVFPELGLVVLTHDNTIIDTYCREYGIYISPIKYLSVEFCDGDVIYNVRYRNYYHKKSNNYYIFGVTLRDTAILNLIFKSKAVSQEFKTKLMQ